MAGTRPYDPLSLIPSAAAVEKRLAEARELVRRLEVVLKTARELEHEDIAADPEFQDQEPQGG